jgi:hypothetical protein
MKDRLFWCRSLVDFEEPESNRIYFGVGNIVPNANSSFAHLAKGDFSGVRACPMIPRIEGSR